MRSMKSDRVGRAGWIDERESYRDAGRGNRTVSPERHTPRGPQCGVGPPCSSDWTVPDPPRRCPDDALASLDDARDAFASQSSYEAEPNGDQPSSNSFQGGRYQRIVKYSESAWSPGTWGRPPMRQAPTKALTRDVVHGTLFRYTP